MRTALPLLALVACAPARHATGPSRSLRPCSACHDAAASELARADRDEHEEILLRHGGAERWCFDCHDPFDRDQLRLVDQLVPLADAQLRCRQCHRLHYREWRRGLAARPDPWRGLRQYLLCPVCHDAAFRRGLYSSAAAENRLRAIRLVSAAARRR